VLLYILGAVPAPGAVDMIVLGSALSLTGPSALGGTSSREGYELAIRKINENGGVKVGGRTYRLVLRYYDDESISARAMALAERLIAQDGVKFMLGPYGSGPTKAVLPVIEKYKVPMVEAGGEARELFTKGYRYNFAVLSPADQYLVPAVHFAAENAAKFGKTAETLKVALAMQKEALAQDVRAGVLEEIRRHGMRVVIDDQVPAGIDDMSATLRKVEMLKPDLLLVSGQEKGALTALRQIEAMKIYVPMLAVTHCETAKLAETLGKTAEHVFCTHQWHRSLGFGDAHFRTAEAFAEEFEQAYKHETLSQAAQAAAAVQVLADAFARAQSLDPEAVRDAVAETELETFFGPVKFDESGRNVAKPMVLTQIQDGKYVVITPAEQATGTAVLPPVAGKP
jgi:branched-chain amino acid transport system substrate-binding protein